MKGLRMLGVLDASQKLWAREIVGSRESQGEGQSVSIGRSDHVWLSFSPPSIWLAVEMISRK
jgi:hypothetical protein